MNKNKKLRKIAPVALAGLVLIGASAWLTNTETQTGVNKIKSGTMVVKFVDTSETIKREDTVINLSGAQMIPMTEKFAVENLNAYNFTLKNSGDVDVTYTLYLVSDGSEFAPSILNIDMDGKFEGVDNKEPQSITIMEKNARQPIDTGIIKAKESITYNEMRLFANQNAVVQDMLNTLNGDMIGRIGKFHLEIEAEQVKTGDEVKTGSTKFTDGTVLNWADTMKPENGVKYGYNADAVKDDRLLDSAFENCDQLEEITLPSTMTTLGNNSLAGTGLTKVDIPEGVTTVGNNALANNNKLTTVKLPSTLTNLGSNVVSGSPNISNITYNGTQEDLDKVNKGEDALPTDKVEVKPSTPIDTELTSPGAKFSDNKVLSWNELKLASNGEKYGYDASLISDNSISANTFKFNNQLSEIFIPSTVQTIGDYAFLKVNLNKITLSEGVVTIGEEAFWKTSVSEVLIPSSVTSIGDSAFSSNDNLSKVEFAPNSNLSLIGFMSFAKCPNLASIEIPSSLKTISYFAFEESGLTSIKLNEGLEDIENNAFDGTKITKLDLPTTLKNISFYNSTQIKEVSFANGTTTFPSLTSSVSLETVSLPSTITKIDPRQFVDSSKLTTIKYGGTMAQWDSLEKGWSWDENTSLKQIICSDGTIKLGIINVDGIEYDFNKEELEDLTSLLSSNNNTSHFALGEGGKLLFRKDVSQISLSTNPSLWKKITTPEGNYVYKNDVTSLTSYKSKNVISINIDNTIEQIDLNDYFELKRIDNLDYNTTAKFASKKTDNGLVLMYKTNLGWKEVQLEGIPISCNAYENLYTSITNEKTYTTTSYNASVLNINLDGKTYNINPSNLTEATILNVQVSGISPKDNTTQFMFINKRLAFRENTSNSPTSITSWKYLTKQQEYPDKTSWCGSLYQDDLQSLEDQSIIDDYSASLIKEISIDGQVINYNVSEIIPTLTSENMEKGKYSLQGIKFATVQGNYDYLVFNLDSDYDETSSASREWKYINKPENANTYGEYLQSLYYVPYDQLVFTSSSAFTTYNDAILPSWDASQPIRLSQLKDYKTTEMASYGNTYALDGEYVVCKTQYSFNSPNSWQYLVKDNNANELSKIKLSELKNYNGKIDTLIRNTNSNNLKGYFPISEN